MDNDLKEKFKLAYSRLNPEQKVGVDEIVSFDLHEPKIKSFLGFSSAHDVSSWDDKSCPQSIRDRIEKYSEENNLDFDGVEISAGSPYNDRAIQAPTLEDDYDNYEAWYAKTKDITRIIKNARANGYKVDINNEYEGVMY